MWLCYLGAVRRNDNWPWDVTVWRMLDKQSRSNYTQLLLQMKRIKANESHTGQHRGCLMKREWETERRVFVCLCVCVFVCVCDRERERERERQKVFVCLRHARTILWSHHHVGKKERKGKKKNPSVGKQQLTMQLIMFTEVCIRRRWLGESGHSVKTH